ncbi:MAG TPA: IPT/TIG domain-containing protein [Kofleriaceae bacterium]|nr:IPT/TIG domain-containing protein [Kofleriaceae bacterium]
MKRALLGLVLAATACGEVTTNGNDNPPPTVEAVTPERGGVPGGHTVTVTGAGFTANDAGDNYVIVGDVAATDVTAVDDATLTFTLPPGSAPDLVVDLTVFNNNGFAVLPDAIQYSPYPTVLSLSETYIRSSGDSLTIFGSGFEDFGAGDNVVTIGGEEATSVEVVSDTELDVEVAPRPDDVPAFERLDVVVTNANGAGTLPESFSYTKPGLLRFGWDRGVTTTITFLDLDGDQVQEIPIATTSVGISSVTLANNGRIYALVSGPSRTSGGQSLATVDPLTGAVQFIDLVSGAPGDTIRRIAFTNGVLYGMLRNNRQLASIDRETGVYTGIGAASSWPYATGCCYGFGMTRRNDTTLWGVTTLQEPLYIINTSDSSASAGPTLTGETSTRTYGLQVFGGKLYGLTSDSAQNGVPGQTLVEIDTTTGAVTRLHQFAAARHSTIVQTPPVF